MAVIEKKDYIEFLYTDEDGEFVFEFYKDASKINVSTERLTCSVTVSVRSLKSIKRIITKILDEL